VTMRAIIVCLAAIGAAGCVLPSYDEHGANKTGADDAKSMLQGAACGLSNKLPTTCDACIRKHCCDLAKDCGSGTECGKDLLEPITPVAEFSTEFDPLLACMQDHCDEACEVSWGCVDDYKWPVPKQDLDVVVTVVDFAAVPDKPLADVDVQACEAVDAACQSGKVTSAKTGKDGKVELKLPHEFDGFFSFSGAGYTDSTVQWTEPAYRVSGFKQLQLQPEALAELAVIVHEHKKVDEPFDPDAGHLIFRAQNCLPMRYLEAQDSPRGQAAGVEVMFEPNDGASQIFYTQPNGGVSITLEATTSDGVGGAFDVPATNVDVHAVDAHSGKEVAGGSVRVRAGAIGYAYLVPRASH
jgi:hypothetical protein